MASGEHEPVTFRSLVRRFAHYTTHFSLWLNDVVCDGDGNRNGDRNGDKNRDRNGDRNGVRNGDRNGDDMI